MQYFSAAVKDEILDGMTSRAKCDACLLGMLIFCKDLSRDELELMTENKHTADFFAANLSRISQRDVKASETAVGRRTMYDVFLADKDSISKIYEYYHVSEDKFSSVIEKNGFVKKKLLHEVIAGAFLACGSVNDPNKPSHMEFVITSVELCNYIGWTLIEECGVTAKQTVRGRHEVVYLKDSECIQDVLIYIGAPASALKHITVKVDKEGSNRLNRSINCTSANLKKMSAAAQKQVEAINILAENGRLDELSQELRQAAKARTDNPDMSLNELCDVIGEGVTKSSLNRRLNKLIDLARDL